MANRTLALGAVVVVALAALLWWTARDDADAPTTEAVTAPTEPSSVDGDDPASPAATASDPTPATSATDTAVDAAAVDAAAEVVPAEAVGTASPFATTEDDEVAADVRGINGVTETPAVVAPSADADDGTGDDAAASGRVVVPSSYPIEDAAKYYLPPEERGPGNLGGPPPLDFPGGPNDPNRADGGFAPPAAPGQ